MDIRVRGASSDGGGVFFGIADSGDVATYLSGVNYDEVTSIDFEGSDVEYSTHDGTSSPSAPGLADIWVASTEGSGEQTLDWSIEAGQWSLVVMNADASAGNDATLVFGAKISNFVLVMWVGLVIGVFTVLFGGFMLYRGFSRSRTSETAAGG